MLSESKIVDLLEREYKNMMVDAHSDAFGSYMSAHERRGTCLMLLEIIEFDPNEHDVSKWKEIIGKLRELYPKEE